jgi:hypothetical protein
MRNHSRTRIFAVATAFALVLSLFAGANAFADDATPPPVQTEEPVPPPTEEPVATDTPAENQPSEVVEPPLSTPETPAEETVEPPLSTETPPEELPADTPTILELLPQATETIVPTETVVESQTTTLAANIFVVNDPIWCPEGASPVAGSGGCTSSYASLSSLVYTAPEPIGNGVIWITSGNDLSSAFISIDGNVFTNWRNYSLTVQGGWNGDNLGTITSNTTFGRPIEIVNWHNNVTLNDIVMNGVSSSGLTVQTTGNIVLNDISSNGNNGIGAELTSTAGDITLTGVNQFNNNSGTGAELVSNGNVTLTGTNQFTGNGDTGLYVNADGAITAQNITANDNGAGHSYGYGAEFNGSSLDISGTNVFNGNSESGVYADIQGDIAISDITANSNGVAGGYGAGAELISSSGSVILNGSNTFDGNLSEGLAVDAPNGISISGTQLINNLGSGANLISIGDVMLDCSSVVGNAGYGVDADSPNLVFNGVELDQNGGGNVVNSGTISYNSNSCFTYPVNGGNNVVKSSGGGINIPSDPTLPANILTTSSGQLSRLDCEQYSGTVLALADGNGAYLPCALGETARLIDMEQDAISNFLPRGYKFISSFNLNIMKQNQPLKTLGEAESIWFWNTGVNENGQEYSQVLYWDGKDWVEAGDKTIPFIRVFFLAPETVNRSDLAIFYWDGSNWVELSDDLNLGSGRFVHRGGYSNGPYFEAEVNFIGTFVLAQK